MVCLSLLSLSFMIWLCTAFCYSVCKLLTYWLSPSIMSYSAAPWPNNSPPGSSVYGTFQARTLDWVAISFFRGASWPREDQTWVSHIAGRFFTIWATREATNIALGEIKCVWLSIWHEYELLLILFPFLKTRYIYPLMHLFIFGYAGSWLWHVGSFFSFVVGHCLLFSFSPGA